MNAPALLADLSGGVVGSVLLARPSDGEDFTTTSVTPGLAGAVAMLILGLAVLLLALDMSRRIRRVQARARVEEKLRLEDEAAAEDERRATEGEDRSGDDEREYRDGEDRPADGEEEDRPADVGGSGGAEGDRDSDRARGASDVDPEGPGEAGR